MNKQEIALSYSQPPRSNIVAFKGRCLAHCASPVYQSLPVQKIRCVVYYSKKKYKVVCFLFSGLFQFNRTPGDAKELMEVFKGWKSAS
jgi:hypothetical protein